MSQETELLTEIRDLLQVMAEPALAKRDAKLRSALRSAVGNSKQKAKAVMLMDGSRAQSAVAKEAGIDQGNLSRFVKVLAAAHLIAQDEKHPQMLLRLPSTFFDGENSDD